MVIIQHKNNINNETINCISCYWNDNCPYAKDNEYCHDYFSINQDDEENEQELIEMIEKNKQDYRIEFNQYIKEYN